MPLSVSPAPAQRAGASAEAATGPVFAYEPLVDAAGAPVSAEAVAEQLRLPQMTRAGSAAAEADQPISVSNGQLIGVDGQPVTLKGINWCAAPPASAHAVMYARRYPEGWTSGRSRAPCTLLTPPHVPSLPGHASLGSVLPPLRTVPPLEHRMRVQLIGGGLPAQVGL